MYSPRWLFLYPGLFLMIAGAGLMAWLLPAERPFGHANLSVDTLSYCAAAVLIGFELCFFAIATKVFAITEGLLPEDDRLNRMFRYITLEKGLIASGLLILIGLGIAVSSIIMWSQNNFGPLPPLAMMRRTLPSMLCILLGTEMGFASFFLSILGLRR